MARSVIPGEAVLLPDSPQSLVPKYAFRKTATPGSSRGTPAFILQAGIRIRRDALGVRHSGGIEPRESGFNFHELGETNGLA